MYLFVFVVEFVIVYHIVTYCAIFMGFPLGVCRFLTAFADDIIAEVNMLNKVNEREDREASCYKALCRIIEFHSKLKR